MFTAWLQPVLLEKDIDYDVYGSYIISILSDEDGGDDTEMKKESINEILQSFMEDDCTSLCDEILAQWNQFNLSSQQEEKGDVSAVTKLIATHLNVEANQIIKTPSVTTKEEEERASIKKSVIAMYNQDEDEEQEQHEQQSWNGTGGSSDTNGDVSMFQNTNVSSIIEKEKMERNKQKDDAAKKKERDKQERKNQENKKVERKEKEKKRTQKKERNR